MQGMDLETLRGLIRLGERVTAIALEDCPFPGSVQAVTAEVLPPPAETFTWTQGNDCYERGNHPTHSGRGLQLALGIPHRDNSKSAARTSPPPHCME